MFAPPTRVKFERLSRDKFETCPMGGTWTFPRQGGSDAMTLYLCCTTHFALFQGKLTKWRGVHFFNTRKGPGKVGHCALSFCVHIILGEYNFDDFGRCLGRYFILYRWGYWNSWPSFHYFALYCHSLQLTASLVRASLSKRLLHELESATRSLSFLYFHSSSEHYFICRLLLQTSTFFSRSLQNFLFLCLSCRSKPSPNSNPFGGYVVLYWRFLWELVYRVYRAQFLPAKKPKCTRNLLKRKSELLRWAEPIASDGPSPTTHPPTQKKMVFNDSWVHSKSVFFFFTRVSDRLIERYISLCICLRIFCCV